MDFADLASLAIAASDLKQVQSLIGAIRRADLESLASGNSALSPRTAHRFDSYCDRYDRQCCDDTCCRDDSIEKTRVVYRPVYRTICCPPPPSQSHARPRLALEPADATTVAAIPKPCQPPAIQPPWAIAPWKISSTPPPRVKLVEYHTDILSKGSMIDMFI